MNNTTCIGEIIAGGFMLLVLIMTIVARIGSAIGCWQ